MRIFYCEKHPEMGLFERPYELMSHVFELQGYPDFKMEECSGFMKEVLREK